MSAAIPPPGFKPASSVHTKNPTDFLQAVIGSTVNIRLNSGLNYRGKLACLDGYMNIALEQTQEYVGNQLKRNYGDAFIRGNNACEVMERAASVKAEKTM